MWRTRGQSYECQVEIAKQESRVSIHTCRPRFILPAGLELEGEPAALQLTPTSHWNVDYRAYEFADFDASKDAFITAIGDRVLAVIKKVRPKRAPAVVAGNGAPAGAPASAPEH